MKKISPEEKLSKFDEYWSPRIIGELNGQYVKLAKLKGEFVWHSHENEDELFYVVKGTLIMEFRDKIETVEEGEMIIVPRGVEHFPRSGGDEVHVMLFEPKETLHTGEVQHELTNNDQEWV